MRIQRSRRQHFADGPTDDQLLKKPNAITEVGRAQPMRKNFGNAGRLNLLDCKNLTLDTLNIGSWVNDLQNNRPIYLMDHFVDGLLSSLTKRLERAQVRKRTFKPFAIGETHLLKAPIEFDARQAQSLKSQEM